MTTIIPPTNHWLDMLKVGDIVYIFSNGEVGGEINVTQSKIKSISKTGIMQLEGSAYSFKNGYRRGFQYSGNCWLQQSGK